MAESPPYNSLIGCDRGSGSVGGGGIRRPIHTSPKTPSHPSRGYAVANEDDTDNNIESSGSDVGLAPISSIATNNTPSSLGGERSHDSICAHDMHSSTKRPQNYKSSSSTRATNYQSSPPRECSTKSNINNTLIPSVSNEDDYMVVSQSQSDAPPQNNLLQPPKLKANNKGDTKRNRRKSSIGADNTKSKASRRRSLRIQARVLDTPEKKTKPSSNNLTNSSVPMSMEDELNTTVNQEEDDGVNTSSITRRRRSIRVLARELDSPAPVKSQKKKQTISKSKRRYSSQGHPPGRTSSPKKRRGKGIDTDVGAADSNKEQQLGPYDELPPSEQLLPTGNKKTSDETTSKPQAMEIDSSSPNDGISISHNGHVSLTQALEKIAFDIVVGPSTDVDSVSNRKSGESAMVGERSVSKKREGSGSSLRRGDGQASSVLESLDEHAASSSAADTSMASISSSSCQSEAAVMPTTTLMEHDASISSTTKRARPKNRRDTFDLSKNRGLISAARVMDLNVLIDDTTAADAAASSNDNNQDYVTPKAGEGTEVNIDNLKDDNEDQIVISGEGTEDYATVMSNMSHVTSVTIKEKMAQLISADTMKQVNKYPCVSARIFASMSIVYADQANFTPLLPFLLSLVNAEIVSLKNKEENEVCFINKKVCFSGFDYSSTTTTVGEVVGQGGGDLCPSIEALELVLQNALKLSRPVHYLDVAIQCLHCMITCDDVSEACAETMVGYFPSARFTKAFTHYMNELKDVKRFVLSQGSSSSTNAVAPQDITNAHMGVRYRLNDFIGRSVRYHLRELINTIPETVVDFNVDECEERWGRAVDDRSISSIVNFALERIHDLMALQPALFEYGVQTMPNFFSREAFLKIHTLSKDDLKKMDKSMYDSLVMDITEARSFLFGARACKFVLSLLNFPGVEEHIDEEGGWKTIESITSTFYQHRLNEGSENGHFVQLREVRDLIFVSLY